MLLGFCKCDTLESPSKMPNTNISIASQLYHGTIATQAFGVSGPNDNLLQSHDRVEGAARAPGCSRKGIFKDSENSSPDLKQEG